MIENLPDVPPAFTLLLNELSGAKSVSDVQRRIKKLFKELRRQSELFEATNASRSDDHTFISKFNVHLHGALNPLSGSGCSHLDCRAAMADRLARSICLIADCVWITDNFSSWFSGTQKPDSATISGIISDYLILKRLEPLIRSGVIKFRSPYFSICAHCHAQFQVSVSVGAEKLAKTFANEFHVQRLPDGGYKVETGSSHEPSTIYLGSSTRTTRIPRRSEFAKKWIRSELKSALWIAREASLTGGAVLSNSRIGVVGLTQESGRAVDIRTIALLEKEREIIVPWVSHLNASQIVQLRDEASSALPAFREKICRAMAVDDGKSKPQAIVADLREQAQEVKAELAAKQKNSAKYWKATYGILGLGLSAYGVATDQPMPAVAGLLPIIQLLIGHKTGVDTDIEKIISKPGYVLVKAQDILAHSH